MNGFVLTKPAYSNYVHMRKPREHFKNNNRFCDVNHVFIGSSKLTLGATRQRGVCITRNVVDINPQNIKIHSLTMKVIGGEELYYCNGTQVCVLLGIQ